MSVDPETRRQLLELVYDLLGDDEAAELRLRIASDPELAGAHAEALEMAGLFSDAAKVELPRISLTRPMAEDRTAEPSRPRGRAIQNGSRKPWARGANWAAGAAAAILMIVSMFGWFYHRSQMADIAAGHLRLRVTGPAELQAGVENKYLVTTASITGKPVEAKIRFALFSPDGDRLMGHTEQTDEKGRLRIAVPADLRLAEQIRLEVTAGDEDTPERVDTRLRVRPVHYATYLSLDKPLYQPGETVYYRSLTLSRFDLGTDGELPIGFEVQDPSGAIVSGSEVQGVTTRSVGCGSFDIPPTLSGGEYSLVARSLDGTFPNRRRTFLVCRYRLPRLKKELEFLRESYSPGDAVLADLSVQRAEGGPAADASLHIRATLNDKLVYEDSGRASAAGTLRIKFALPDEIGPGDGQLLVAADDGSTLETIAKTIPINLNDVDVVFCPEGGELVAGMANRVYFSARDSTGKPVEISGTILNSLGQAVAQAETTHQGMGVFGFEPRPGGQYRLRITEPPGAKGEPRLPEVSASGQIVLDAGIAVFNVGEPLEFNLRSIKDGLPLVASAWCRGVPVGQQTLITKANANSVSIPIGDDVSGVIRLTIHDYRTNPPEPVAERLVYRRPKHRLRIKIDGADRYSPGDPVSLEVAVTDESEQPTPAVLGAMVVDDAVLGLADDNMPGMSTYFMLTSEIADPEDLENADFYLSEEKGAPATLDLLLGTRGWRRFVDKSLDELRDEGRDDEQLDRLIAIGSETNPPAMFDNLQELQSRYKTSLSEYRSNRSRILSTLTSMIFFGSLGLVLLVTMLSLLDIASGVRLWGPAVGVAMASLIIGLVVMNPEGRGPAGMGDVAFVPFDMAPPPPKTARSSKSAKAFEPHEQPRMEGLEEETKADDERDGPVMKKAAPAEELAAAPKDADDVPMPRSTFSARAAAQLDTMSLRQAGQAAYGARGRQAPELLDRIGNEPVVQRSRKSFAKGGQAAGKEEDGRVFKVRQYQHQHRSGPTGARADFAQTLFWHPLLLTDADGKAQIDFDLSDSITTFRILVDGHAVAGRIGSGAGTVISRIPFNLEPKIPEEVGSGDFIDLPLAVVNDSVEKLPVELTLGHGELVRLEGEARSKLVLRPQGRERVYFPLEVIGRKGECRLTFRGTAGRLADAVEKSLRVVPPGFPQAVVYGGQIDGEEEVVVKLPDDWVPGSLEVSLCVFPSLLADLREGLQSILDQPHGSFEQALAANYPNVLALKYMQENGVADPAMTRRAKRLLATGHTTLIGYESSTGGYASFGDNPGHEVLTALGLMGFGEMRAVYDVDQEMIERTTQWLLERRDGKGGFQRNPEATDGFGSSPADVTDAYITWALSESGQADIEAEVRHVVELAGESNDPYLLALAGAAAVNAGRKGDGNEILARLAAAQAKDGHLTGAARSIVRSGGRSLKTETTALAALAWMKLPEYVDEANRAVEWIIDNRQARGGFGSTQATVLALKALSEHAKANRLSGGGGKLTVRRETALLAELSFSAGRHQAVTMAGLEEKLTSGDNRLIIGLTGNNRLPYTLSVTYRNTKPTDHEGCPVRLSTELAAKTVPQGESVKLVARITNDTDDPQPMTVAVLGLPAGLEVRPDQLEELKDTRVIDHYETRGRELVCYWRSLAPRRSIELNLDLIAAMPGRYTGPASRVYLYYTSEQERWNEPLAIEISRP
jgi:A-macroglobulin complement component/alpha-2-macroglobulin family protein/MG2 domain-containing protein/A-macroglobulin receptor